MEFDQAAAERILGEELTFIALFTDDEKETDNYKAFKAVAAKRSSEMVFTRSKISKDLGEKLCEFIGITEKKDTLRIIQFS